ncbi:MAG: GAF domain-containing protein [Opitutaceae bacterium]|nr:GAF domain-containing protein [Opitutaceae bacterium]
MKAATDSVGLRTCDQEPIHIPGSIQPHGFLLGVNPATGRITHASENAGNFLGHPASSLLGTAFSDVFGIGILRRLGELVARPEATSRVLPVARHLYGPSFANPLDLVTHLSDGTAIVEGEEAALEPHEPDSPASLQPTLVRIEACQSTAELCQVVVEEMKRLSGFDRALLYRFDDDWNGSVIAEAGNNALPSYLGLRFPAADIPSQARELYRRNRLRLILTHTYTPQRVLHADEASPAPLDLSLSTLRSVSPVHLQYMRNMGTVCSLSASLLRNGKLWGLLSCHHTEPRRLPFTTRATLEQLAHVFSLTLASLEEAESYRHRARLQTRLPLILADMARNLDCLHSPGPAWEEAIKLAGAAGVAYLTHDSCVRQGNTPGEQEVRAIGQWLETQPEHDLISTHCLEKKLASATQLRTVASGLLAASVSPSKGSYVLWFRPEAAETVTWGGNPRKGTEFQPDSLSPRTSFNAWTELLRGQSEPWRVAEIETAKAFRNGLVSIVLRQAEELAAASERLSVANQELAAFSYTVSHDLRAPFRHIRAYAEILKEEKGATLDADGITLINRILDSAEHAGLLVENLLAFSQTGKLAVRSQPLPMTKLVNDMCARAIPSSTPQVVEWQISPCPTPSEI